MATKPDPGHKVTICHATNSDTNPYVVKSVDIASSGYLKAGHADHMGPIWSSTLKGTHTKWGDIIPPYTYGAFAYAGLNWTSQGQAIWNADCAVPKPAVVPSPSASTSLPPSASASVQPSGSVEAETGTLQPSGSVEAATGVAVGTLPATDVVTDAAATVSADGWRILLLVMAVVLGAALVLTPAGSRRR